MGKVLGLMTAILSIFWPSPVPTPTPKPTVPLFISVLRQRNYQASPLVVDQTLAPGVNYQRYIAWYRSDGLKIFGLLTVPNGPIPEGGFPAIVFLHGHLDPKTYVTTDRYVAYQDGFARTGFVTFKPDLRGHGRSESQAVNSSFSPDYVIDALNVVAAFKADRRINPERIGMWGHSMGGEITLKAMVVTKDIKAGVIWAGVVGSYSDLVENYKDKVPWAIASPAEDYFAKYGLPSENPQFWAQIDPYYYLKDISGPVQLHHGTGDTNVPYDFSIHLEGALMKAGKTVEFYSYPGADHNLTNPAFAVAMQRSVEFFKKYL